MADNPYGDGGTKEWDFSNRGNSRVDSSRSRGVNTRSSFDNMKSMADNSAIAQLDKMVTDQGRQLHDMVTKVRQERVMADRVLQEKNKEIEQKDEEIQQLRDELALMKKKFEEVSGSRGGSTSRGAVGAVGVGAAVSVTLSRPRTKALLMPGMQAGDTLYKFIDRDIRPNQKFNSQCLKIIDKLVRSLQAKTSPFNIKRIVKGGSLGKGTSVKDKSDIDLIIFFNGYSTVQDLQLDKARLLQQLEEYVKKDWSEHLLFKGKTPFSLQFYLKIDDDDKEHEVDLLPALDITQSGRQLSEIYSEMKGLSRPERDPYACCVSPLQLEFVSATNRVSTPGKVKDLIRLLKYWIKVEDVPLRSYFLELLVVRQWREAGTPQDIDLEGCLRDVIKQLIDCKTMAIAFSDHYDYKDYRKKLEPPFLLDPANPFRNVAPVSKREVEMTARKAATLLKRWEEA
ncbi:2'-5'-oligoadenylate synthase 1-like isoform X1 [Haliotis rufescens]|uniref:2'-5'-oligoadenylate synthase 1-like isoform X1 n=2 Tax=Haliotis rufescens TaxID=6454 RepID=UPI001EB06A9A|nr:2'-5'-oligoadenylate synthase 1-like isoform X1 [Haliotis rufescens]